jgi:integrase
MGYVYRQPGRGRLTYMARYSVQGVAITVSTGTQDLKQAEKFLRARETDRDRGLPVAGDVGKVRFEAAAEDLLTDYTNNDRRSIDNVEGRVRLHLAPFFQGWKMADIQTPAIRLYSKTRRSEGAANSTINRELALLKRMFVLAIQGGKLLYRPHVPMLSEHNVRAGFFEREAFDSVWAHLPEAVRPVMTFAYITGWRIDSEILPLEWRQVDLDAGEVRLDPETTKNGRARVFPLTGDLRAVLEQQQAVRHAVLRTGQVCPWVFIRLVRIGGRGLSAQHRQRAALVVVPKPIKRFNKSWATACRAAGQPGKIPHDFRRTAIRNMVRRGVPERVAMQLTGHLTRSVFERYNIVSPGDLRDAAARLEGLTSPVNSLTGSTTGSTTSAVAGFGTKIR